MNLADLVNLLAPALAAGVASWAAIKVELRYLRRDVDAAHRRLDKIKAPAAGAAVADNG